MLAMDERGSVSRAGVASLTSGGTCRREVTASLSVVGKGRLCGAPGSAPRVISKPACCLKSSLRDRLLVVGVSARAGP